MTIRVDIYGDDPDDCYVFANFIFVGTNDRKPAKVNPLLVQTLEEEHY